MATKDAMAAYAAFKQDCPDAFDYEIYETIERELRCLQDANY